MVVDADGLDASCTERSMSVKSKSYVNASTIVLFLFISVFWLFFLPSELRTRHSVSRDYVQGVNVSTKLTPSCVLFSFHMASQSGKRLKKSGCKLVIPRVKLSHWLAALSDRLWPWKTYLEFKPHLVSQTLSLRDCLIVDIQFSVRLLCRSSRRSNQVAALNILAL